MMLDSNVQKAKFYSSMNNSKLNQLQYQSYWKSIMRIQTQTSDFQQGW